MYDEFEVGDIVEVFPHYPDRAWPGSPVLNLQGSIARIINKDEDGLKWFYNLEFIDIKAERPEKVNGDEGKLHWEDIHLKYLGKDDIQEIDISSIFQE